MSMRLGIVALVFLGLVPGARGAAPVSVPDPTGQEDVVTFAAGRLLWTTHTDSGPIVVHQRLVPGGLPTTLATIVRTKPLDDTVALALAANAGGYVLAIRDEKSVDNGGEGGSQFHADSEHLLRGGYDGSVQDVLRCVPPPARQSSGDDTDVPLEVVAGTSEFAFGGALCAPLGQIDTISATGEVAAVSQIPPSFAPSTAGFGFTLTEPELAVEVGPVDHPKVRVIDLVTGQFQDLAADSARLNAIELGVLGDGTLVLGNKRLTSEGLIPIYAWRAGAATPARVPGIALEQLAGVVTGAGQIFAPLSPENGQLGLGLVNPEDGALRVVGAPGAGEPRDPLFFDGTTAVMSDTSCAGSPEVTVVDVTAPAPSAPLGCPFTVLTKTLRFDAHRHAHVSVQCPNGCDGILEVTISGHQLSKHEIAHYIAQADSGVLARARLRFGPSTAAQTVTLTLAKPAVSLLRRHHRIKASSRIVGNAAPERLGADAQVVTR